MGNKVMRREKQIETTTTTKKKKHSFVQRCLYAIVGILAVASVILLTLAQIRGMHSKNHEFAFCLLLLVQSGCLLASILVTALFCRLTDAVLTTIAAVLLSTYTGVHFFVRFQLCNGQSDEQFFLIAVRMGFVLIILILFVPWTGTMVHEHRMRAKLSDLTKEIQCPRATTFSWFLYLDLMLTISLLTLNVRSQEDFGLYQILVLSIGIPLALIWLCMGMLMTNPKTFHWFVSTVFYILSIVQMIHLAYITYWAIYESSVLSKVNEETLFPLLIVTFVCGGTSALIHLLTIIISFALFHI